MSDRVGRKPNRSAMRGCRTIKLCGAIRRQACRVEALPAVSARISKPLVEAPVRASVLRGAGLPAGPLPPDACLPRETRAQSLESPEFPAAAAEGRPPHRGALLLGLRSRVADGLYRRRGVFRTPARIAANVIAAITAAPWADRFTIAIHRRSRSGGGRLAGLGFWLVRRSLTLAVAAHLAAGQTESAVRDARMLNLLFRHRIRTRQRPEANLYFETMYRSGLLERIAREVRGREFIADHHLNHVIARSRLLDLDCDLAGFYVRRAVEINPCCAATQRLLGRVSLAKGELAAAARAFDRSVQLNPKSVMAHQNYAGRYDRDHYTPADWELKNAGELLIYDNLGQMAEELTHRGRFDAAYRYYGQMLAYQSKLAEDRVLPQRLVADLAARYPQFDAAQPCRILPFEWVTQIGHLGGLIDCYYKMTRLGMLPRANYLLLAPRAKVCNPDLLAYWDRYFTIVRDDQLVNDLFPYQRYFGDGFSALRCCGEEAEPWTHAGARAQVEWARQGRAPLLTLSPADRDFGYTQLRAMGVPQGAWYVALHVREGGFHRDFEASPFEHRNSRIEDYFGAIREIVDRGGFVIRLGDRGMHRLPAMPQVIDYATGPHKSSRMDVFLLAACRFFIGTTSGLTNAALAFGTPALLLNCISNDWQLWPATTDFTLKRVFDKRNRRFLSLQETYRQPQQAYLVNKVVLERRGYAVVGNTKDEITEAVRYKLDDTLEGTRQPCEGHEAIDRYHQSIAQNRYIFGAGRPVLPFILRHPELLRAASAPHLAA